jgi:hypothetical protein
MLSLCVEAAGNAYDIATRYLTYDKSGVAMSSGKFIKYSHYGLRFGIALPDCCPYSVWALGIREAYHDFEKKQNRSKQAMLSFSVYPNEVKFSATKLNLGRISNITLPEAVHIPAGIKLYNPRCFLDLDDWYLSVEVLEKDTAQKPDNRERICINDKSEVYINLMRAYNRLSPFIDRYERKITAPQNYSNNMIKAKQSLTRQVKHIRNIIRDMEHKYDCSSVRRDVNNVKKQIERLINILNEI